MKNLKKSFLIILVLLLGSSVWFSACNNETNMDPDIPDDPTEVKIDPDELLERFIVKNATVKSGTLSVPENVPNLKREYHFHYEDSLLFVRDIDLRFVLNGPGASFGGFTHFYFQVEGGKKFLEIKPDELESNDSIGVFYMGFDPEGLELPITFKVKIEPYGASEGKTTILESIVKVLDSEDKSCDLVHPINTWRWMYTLRDGKVVYAPGFGERFTTFVTGCCNAQEERSINCLQHFIPESEWIRLEGISAYLINHEVLEFSATGITGTLQEYVQNLNPKPEESNFCTGELDYLISTRNNEFWGEYTFDASSGSLQFKDLESKVTYVELFGNTYPQYDKMFISVAAKYEVFGCRYLKETSTLEGSSTIRIFERVADVAHE